MENHIILVLSAFIISTVCGFIIIPYIINFCIRKKLYDIPNARKIHKNVIPRLGGICFLPCTLIAFIFGISMLDYLTGRQQFTVGTWSVMFLISLSLIYIIGIVDDIVGVRPRTKFAVQIIAASLLPISGLYINNFYGMFGIYEVPFWIGAPLTVFALVFIDNAMNLIDGIDGLSGGLALLSLTGFLLCFIHEGIYTYAILIAGLMGVLTAYLYFNIWGKAEKGHKIFMGDSGSLTLGFILGFLLIKFAMHNPNVMPYRNNSLLITYTLLIVPCFDVVRVIITRLKNHYPIFKADKNHIHHKLMRAGMTQHQALVTILILAVTFVVINTAMRPELRSDLVVLIDIIVYTAFQLVTDVFVRRKEHGMQHEADCISK